MLFRSEKSKTYTLIHRNDMQSIGILPEGEGSNYIPQYLINDKAQTPQQAVPPAQLEQENRQNNG